jgi:hypothetical protein
VQGDDFSLLNRIIGTLRFYYTARAGFCTEEKT